MTLCISSLLFSMSICRKLEKYPNKLKFSANSRRLIVLCDRFIGVVESPLERGNFDEGRLGQIHQMGLVEAGSKIKKSEIFKIDIL